MINDTHSLEHKPEVGILHSVYTLHQQVCDVCPLVIKWKQGYLEVYIIKTMLRILQL